MSPSVEGSNLGYYSSKDCVGSHFPVALMTACMAFDFLKTNVLCTKTNILDFLEDLFR
jgi:hypothetical protein